MSAEPARLSRSLRFSSGRNPALAKVTKQDYHETRKVIQERLEELSTKGPLGRELDVQLLTRGPVGSYDDLLMQLEIGVERSEEPSEVHQGDRKGDS
jgi:hypothetical protein